MSEEEHELPRMRRASDRTEPFSDADVLPAADPHPRRSRDTAARLISFLAVIVASLSFLGSVILWGLEEEQNRTIQDAREDVIRVLCNVDKATIAAGQSLISRPSTLPAEVDDFFRDLTPEWPTAAERETAGQESADRYARRIAEAVARSLGERPPRARDPIPTQGLDCEVLVQLGAVDVGVP